MRKPPGGGDKQNDDRKNKGGEVVRELVAQRHCSEITLELLPAAFRAVKAGIHL